MHSHRPSVILEKAVLETLTQLDEDGKGVRCEVLEKCVAPEVLPDVLRRLVEREVLEEKGGVYRFRVELLRRWLKRTNARL